MQRHISTINCLEEEYDGTKRSSPFLLVKYTLFYESNTEDKLLVDSLISSASKLASSVNAEAANGEASERAKKTRLANALAGVVSENLWLNYLNSDGNYVQSTLFSDASSQIDLKTVENGETIEVRSSFPRNKITFALCHPNFEFDILGPYSNARYKPGERPKDYYVRTLFNLPTPEDILEAILKDGFCVYLTGGATHKMMMSDKIAIIKDLKPEDSMNPKAKASYRVIPFSKALDTIQIKALICKKPLQ